MTTTANDTTNFVRREWSRLELEHTALRHRTWGRWGADDELGAANLISPEHIISAAQLVRRGMVFSLALPMDRTGPQTGEMGRINPQHVMLVDGGDISPSQEPPRKMRAVDDAVYMPLQSSTQWDALCHVFYGGQTYNGRGPDSVTSRGAHFNSITNLRDRAVGRGVLLDLPRMVGRPWLDISASIQANDLDRCARHQGVEVGPGDFVLIRTGQIAACRNAGSWGSYAGGNAPGLGISCADYLCPRQIVGVATDTWGVEAIPYECDEVKAPLHVVLLVNAGVHLGEMWDLEALSLDCATDGVYEFLLTAAPLTITGAVGSPINPLAVK